jgi:hypothetical protein
MFVWGLLLIVACLPNVQTGLNGKLPTKTQTKDVWNLRFRELMEYKDKFGHCLVPDSYPENRKLETWVKTQRMQYNRQLRSLALKGSDQSTSSSGMQPSSENATTVNSTVEYRRKEYLKRYKAVYYRTMNCTDGQDDAGQGHGKIKIVAMRKKREIRADRITKTSKLWKERFEKLKEIGFYFGRREVSGLMSGNHSARFCICMHICMHTYIYACIHTYMHAYIHTYVHAYIHICMHTYIYACMHTYMHAYTHHKYMHACIHTCML